MLVQPGFCAVLVLRLQQLLLGLACCDSFPPTPTGPPTACAIITGNHRAACTELASLTVAVLWRLNVALFVWFGRINSILIQTPTTITYSHPRTLLSYPTVPTSQPPPTSPPPTNKMPPPAFVLCELCHKKFGKSSIAIHMKQCIAKREASTSFCPVCDNIVSNDEFEKHVAECKVVNAELFKKKKAEAAAAAAAAAKTAKAAPGAKPAGPLSVTGGAVGSGGGGGGGAGGAATGDGDASGGAPARSKVPEHILRKMKEMSEPPETRLQRRLGQPCDACGSTAANVLCLGCHAVYCVPCSAGIHEVNKALSDHAPTVREVRAVVGFC